MSHGSARRRGRAGHGRHLVQVGFLCRYDTDYRQMKPVIDSGRIVATDIRPQPAFHGRRRMKVA